MLARTDPLLFTPGPLTTSASVKAAMVRDLGSRDRTFIEVVAEVRAHLVRLATASDGYTAVPIQGCGTMGVEAMLTTFVPHDGRLLVCVNGAYGRRMVRIAQVAGVAVSALEGPEDRPTDVRALDRMLTGDPGVTHVALVHIETTTGILNPLEQVAEVVHRHRRALLVDSMSAFGAVPLDVAACGIDALVSSSNKCIQGVPGFSFCIARIEALQDCDGHARSVSLDLLDQWRGLERDGQFRFTPPVQALLAFRQALRELEEEGGVEGRMARYRQNHTTLVEGMSRLGFREYLDRAFQGWVITSFRYPEDPRFSFEEFYRRLVDRGFVIYPGKLTSANCFRIGHIGHLFRQDIEALVAAVGDVALEMGFDPRAGSEGGGTT